MKIKMTAIYSEEFCEDLKEVLGCDSCEEFLGAFKGMILQELSKETFRKEDISVDIELV